MGLRNGTDRATHLEVRELRVQVKELTHYVMLLADEVQSLRLSLNHNGEEADKGFHEPPTL